VTKPTLYVKRGCPFCAAAMDYLNAHNIDFERIEVRGDEAKMEELKKLSGQTKTPTLNWNGKVLANFGTEELEKFLAEQGSAGS
jgi:glutaredoxin 3